MFFKNMRTLKIFTIFVFILLSFIPLSLHGQDSDKPKGYVMNYVVKGKDTIYIEDIPPITVRPRKIMNDKEWTQYYRRVHNFSKAYPYAVFVSQTIQKTDSLFAVQNLSKRKQNKYLSNLKDDLLNNFEPIFKNLTLKQGLMMIRLIDREVGLTPYYILKKYLGGATAGFWQGVAKVLGGDLKKPYDKFGEDKDLEELVDYWENGEFPDLYFSIFGKDPPEIFIPEKFR